MLYAYPMHRFRLTFHILSAPLRPSSPEAADGTARLIVATSNDAARCTSTTNNSPLRTILITVLTGRRQKGYQKVSKAKGVKGNFPFSENSLLMSEKSASGK